jgi:anti-anti-sigma regulatory factor
MKIHMTGNTALLEGDWTLTGVTKSNIDSMADTLQQINTSGVKEIHIDCRNVSSIDTNGLHLINVWAQCSGFRA